MTILLGRKNGHTQIHISIEPYLGRGTDWVSLNIARHAVEEAVGRVVLKVTDGVLAACDGRGFVTAYLHDGVVGVVVCFLSLGDIGDCVLVHLMEQFTLLTYVRYVAIS